MMKKIFALLLVIVMCVGITACGHTHTWSEARCDEPQKCTECGAIQGEALGHTWEEATCDSPKTCKVCGITEGEALGHTWNEATCTSPKRCVTCGAVEGEALGHDWEDATCTLPKTCKTCGETEGEALGHNAPDLSCTTDGVCERCNEIISAPGHTFSDATCTEPAKCTVCGEISGEPLGHTSTTGVCSRCGLEVYETVNGRGDDVVSDIAVGDGVYRVHFTHSGRRNFIVKAYDASNSKDLLINEIGSYDGYVLLAGNSPYAFEIEADGSWSFTVERLDNIADTSFVGKGDYVTGIASISSGTWTFTHDGKSNFVVRIYTTKGRDLLVNEIGNYSGKKIVTIPTGSNAFFEINADGNWSISGS